MALISSYDPIVPSKQHLKPLMLSDHLLDDLSSCSSNGFKSFPRRQCCAATVRFLLENEINRSKTKTSSSKDTKRRLTRSHTTCTAALGFAVQKASTALSNAVKLLPFPSSVTSPSSSVRNRAKKGLLARSFSKKLLRRSFWRKTDHERGRDDLCQIERWREADHHHNPDHECQIRRLRTFAEFLEESLDKRHEQLCHSTTAALTTNATSATTAASTSELSVAVADRRIDSTSSSSENGGDSFDESKFFTGSDVMQSSISSSNSELSKENDAVEDEADSGVEIKTTGERLGAHVGDSSVVNRKFVSENRKEWLNEEKEHFSPVSVLEFPFQDDDEGTDDQKLLHKSRRFGGLARLEPVDLEIRIEAFGEKQEFIKNQCSNRSVHGNILDENTEDDENRVNSLLILIKERNKEPNSLIVYNAAENLLLDFFDEEIKRVSNVGIILKIAEDWVNGRPQELFLGWKVKEKREVYVREMERNEKWGNLDEEREKVIVELENGFFTDLVEELMNDFVF